MLDLVAEFESAAREAAAVLERLPAGRADWRPHPRSRPLGEQAEHLVRLLGYAENLAASTGHDLAKPTPRAGAGASDVAQPAFFPPDLSQRFSRLAAATSGALSKLSAAQLEESWTLSRGSASIVTLPRAAALQVFLISHLRHHTAQLSFCLRLAAV